MKKSIISKASFSYKIEIAIFFYNFLLKKRNLNHPNKDKKKKDRSKKVNTWWHKRCIILYYKEIIQNNCKNVKNEYIMKNKYFSQQNISKYPFIVD